MTVRIPVFNPSALKAPTRTYKFHSEAGDGVAANAGIFSASNGRWALQATNGYADGGTYLFPPPDTWIATGKFGTLLGVSVAPR